MMIIIYKLDLRWARVKGKEAGNSGFQVELSEAEWIELFTYKNEIRAQEL